ncbi:MAG: 6-phosphogluconolactonase [Thermoplasmata archaeon]|nr:6-phosphogluconolactonase [Thermoplasmata archaeon]MCI4359495.1 6-phosphogluconolactonase [Thermoplasmata archaeon]
MVSSVTPRVEISPDLATAARSLAERVVSLARSSLEERGRFALALSGGATPETLFRILADEFRDAAPWSEVDFFWADERAVAPHDPRSNYGLAARTWLGPLSTPSERIHRVLGELPSAEEAARVYHSELRQFFAPGANPPTEPLFDLALLGIGPDGHTASLFPGSPLLKNTAGWVGVEPTPTQPPNVPRISVSLATLNRSREILFLVAGKEKRTALSNVLNPRAGQPVAPAAQVRGLDRTAWYVDRFAAGR